MVHLAGFKYAGVSVSRPLHTYTQNVTAMVALLEAMAAHGVDRFVFSSSAAVYGTPDTGVVTEATPTRPESPYGESKLIGEWLLADQARATRTAPLRHTSLRYFNVVGSGYPDLRDTSPHNLFPLIFEQLVAGRVRYINGDDYPTPDGTCVRDYVHVSDLASPTSPRPRPDGRPAAGAGLQPRQRHRAVGPRDHGRRRPGDRHRLHARDPAAGGPVTRPRSWPPVSWRGRDLDWQMRHTVDEMVASAWAARQAATAEHLRRISTSRPKHSSSHLCENCDSRVTRPGLARNTDQAEFSLTSRVQDPAASGHSQSSYFTERSNMTPLELNSGDTAWILTSAALVLLMTPGLALFYGGMVRAKSVLNMMMMSFGALALISVLWVLYGYSIAFGNDVTGVGLLGDPTEYLGLKGLMARHRRRACRPWPSSPSRPCSPSSPSP